MTDWTSSIPLINRMRRRGWFPQYAGLETPKVLEALDQATFDFELKRYEDWLGEEATLESLAERFCGLEDRPALRGSDCAWPERTISWHTEGGLGAISAADFQQQTRDTWPRLTQHCGATMVYTPNPKTAALFLHAPSTTPSGFGGPGGVLADAQLVPCGLRTNSAFQSEARYDKERWKLGFDLNNDGRIPLGSVIGHEGMHQLGVPHGPANNWMSPTLSGINTCQAWDRSELVKRYGPPKPITPPTPTPVPPTPTPGEKIRINAEWDAATGKLISAAITGARVTITGG